MAVVINPVTSLDKLTLINNNFNTLASAINSSLVWRNGNTPGETSFSRDLDMNGRQILNAYVGNYSLSDVVQAAQGAGAASAAAAASAFSAAQSASSSSSAASSALLSSQQAATSASQSAAAITNLKAATNTWAGVNTFSQGIVGNISSATKLATPRTIGVSLTSSASPGFDGTANITAGVSGVLPVINGGTGGSTQALARSGLGLGAVAVMGLVGTVADGSSIFEQGSGANGSYIKFANGTMLCYNLVASASVTSSARTEGSSNFWGMEYSWTLPATFIANPSCTGGGLAYTAASVSCWRTTVNPNALGTSVCTFRVAADVQFTTIQNLSLVAIGRWKV